jgi:O-acetyl-ADP-ribose deacetylase (regulator of RNase III)
MIEYIQDDLVKSDCDVIIHGCNCFNTMGSGIAKQIRETYPEAYEVDCDTEKGGMDKLGEFTYVIVKNKFFTDKDVYIINAYTQYNYGRKPGHVYVNYKAIDNVMHKINMSFENKPQFKIGMPKIGSGLAQGDWNTIKNIINDVFMSRKIYIYEWKNNEPYKN